MSLAKYSAVVFLVGALCISSLVWADEKGSGSVAKWGLWSDPQVEPLQPAIKEKEASVRVEPGEDLSVKDYILGPGDQLDISVWKDEALIRSLAILPDGKLSFPLVGELVAAGKTVSQLKKEIEAKLSRFIPDPILSIEVKQVNSQIIYVIGRVNAPGRFVLNVNVNILQALAMAGGFNPFAEKSKVKIIRSEGDKSRVIPFDYDEIVKKERLEEIIGLKRGDVVVVP